MASIDLGNLEGTGRDSAAALNQIFASYGLETLGPKIVDFIKNGYSADTVSLLLQDTSEYKQRFAANDVRLKKGLPALSPAEYLATEKSYRQIMQAAGVPSGFYDQPQDFQKFLEDDKSPQEIQQRVQDAQDFINKQNPQALAQFKQWYSSGDMIAYALDPDRAQPLVGKAFKAAAIGSEAARQNLSVDQNTAEQMAAKGISQDAASQGFANIALDQGAAQKLATMAGTNLSTQDLVNETFFNNAGVAQKRQMLASQERGRFGGTSAVGRTSLSTDTGGAI